MPAVFLATTNSGLDWQVDQLIRSDIKENDIVIWGGSFPISFSWFIDSKLYNIWPYWNEFIDDEQFHSKKELLSTMLEDESRIKLSIRHMAQVISFCKKLKVKLVIAYYPIDREVQEFKDFVKTTPYYLELPKVVDLAADRSHPGPITHALYAKRIQEYIENNLKVKS